MGLQRLTLYLGLVLLAHGFYFAFSHREVLQAHHHKGAHGFVPMADFTSGATALTSAKAVMIPVFLEVVVGMVLATLGYVRTKDLRPIRMQEHIRYARYDQQQNTGMGFMHFNHRGTLASRGAAATEGGETPAKSEQEKKKE